MDVKQIETEDFAAHARHHARAYYGHPVDMDPVCRLAQKYGLAIIEDAAEVHGAEYLSGRDAHGSAW